MISRTKNNLDFLRLLAASMVIFSHSYPLTGQEEIMGELTSGQIGLGGLAVEVFFILSGFLIVQSMQKSPTVLNFMWKRILRLFPGLAVMLIFSLFVIAIVYRGNNFLLEKSFWTYLPNNLSLYKVQYNVTSVFENNPYPNAINGSLWSLCYEFTMYLFIAVFFFFRKSKLLLPLLIIWFCLSYYLANFHNQFLNKYFMHILLDTTQLYRLSVYFAAGSILSFVRLQKLNKGWIKVLLFGAILVSLYCKIYTFTAPLIWPVLILLFGMSYSHNLNRFPGKFGDISYGIYIYGFLIQQTIMNFFTLRPILLTLTTMPIVMFLAWLSWHYVEKRCLGFKTLFK